MLRWVFRGIFVLVICTLIFIGATNEKVSAEDVDFWAVVTSGLGIAIFVFLLDLFTPKQKLSALAGVFFGLLVGMILSLALAPIVDLINLSYGIQLGVEAIASIKWIIAACICYLTITIVMRTKDDVRFVIPYVEFAKQTKGARPMVLDTSAIIDGRIVDLCQSKLFDAPLIVPRFVLNELQLISDSPDKLKRNRGRRGLDIIKRMQEHSAIDISIDDTPVPDIEDVKGVDQKLVLFTKTCDGRLVTTDYNLTKVALVREVDVININDLANSLKTIVLPGEALQVKIIKPGEEVDQGIGYLDDGTMVVVEEARNKMGKDILISVTSSLQTSAGKMIFGKFLDFAKNANNKENKSFKNHNSADSIEAEAK